MNAVAALYRSTIGKKVIMAMTGLLMVLWLVTHLLGNLQIFLPAEWIDAYAEHIHELGPLLWALRLIMLSAVALHIWSAVSLIQLSRGARKANYQGGRENLRTTLAARLMRIGGVVILAFLAFHLLDLTLGVFHPSFQLQASGASKASHNLVASLSRPPVAAFYAVSVLFVGLHLSHGVQSAFQTLGANHPKYNALRKGVSVGLGVFLAVGNLAIVFGALLGLVGA